MQKIAVIFPGQGSHFVGMYKALYDEYEIVRETIDEAKQVTGIDLCELCFNGPLSLLSRVENAHVAILAFGVAAFRVFVNETGLTPQFCAGHSLGEYTALVISGAIKFPEALKLVKKRCEISKNIQKVFDGVMTIIDGVETDIVYDICKKQQLDNKKVYLSCYNSSTQTAISGINVDVEYTEKILLKKNGTVSPLFNSAPFHCPIMEDGIELLKNVISDIEFGDFRYPVMSNYTGKPYVKSKDNIKENLLNHLTNPVRWQDNMRYFEKKAVDLVIDFSAKNIFENINSDFKSLKVICFGVRKEREALFGLLQDVKYSSNKATFISKSILAAISTQNNNFNREEYNTGSVNNYMRLLEIRDELEMGSISYTQDVKKKILNLLKNIFDTKKTCIYEQNMWIQQIIDETASNYQHLI